MKKIFLIFVSLILLVACQPKSKPNDSQNFSSNHSTTKPVESSNTLSSSTPVIEEGRAPHYIDETEFSGDQLDIIKTINLRIKFLWEGNEKEYAKLINPNGPLGNYPSYKIERIILTSEISIFEQENISKAVVSVSEERLSDTGEYNSTYVLIKDKTEGSRWNILDID